LHPVYNLQAGSTLSLLPKLMPVCWLLSNEIFFPMIATRYVIVVKRLPVSEVFFPFVTQFSKEVQGNFYMIFNGMVLLDMKYSSSL
jgi:hypothetical protein